MKKNKKITLGLSVLVAVPTISAFVIACSNVKENSDSTKTLNNESSVIKGQTNLVSSTIKFTVSLADSLWSKNDLLSAVGQIQKSGYNSLPFLITNNVELNNKFKTIDSEFKFVNLDLMDSESDEVVKLNLYFVKIANANVELNFELTLRDFKVADVSDSGKSYQELKTLYASQQEAIKQAIASAEAQAKLLAEEKAKLEAEKLAKEKAEADYKAKLEAEKLAKLKAEVDAKAKAEADAKAKAEADAKAKLEADAKVKTEQSKTNSDSQIINNNNSNRTADSNQNDTDNKANSNVKNNSDNSPEPTSRNNKEDNISDQSIRNSEQTNNENLINEEANLDKFNLLNQRWEAFKKLVFSFFRLARNYFS